MFPDECVHHQRRGHALAWVMRALVRDCCRYLSDVEEGGSTYFPRAGGLKHPRNTRDCDGPGLHVQPRAGRGIVFYSLMPDGFGDECVVLFQSSPLKIVCLPTCPPPRRSFCLFALLFHDPIHDLSTMFIPGIRCTGLVLRAKGTRNGLPTSGCTMPLPERI